MWHRLSATVGISVALVAVASGQAGETSRAQTAPIQSGSTQSPGSSSQTDQTQRSIVNLSGFSDDYQVGPGDTLDIQVVGHTDLNQVLRVTNSGEISYPMLGLIPVVDLTAFEVESAIGATLIKKGLLQQPEVLVSVREYQAKPIYVSGAVEHPGQYLMSQDLTVVDAILLAGGLDFTAADEALLHRRQSGAARTLTAASAIANPNVAGAGIEIIKVDLRPLKQGRFLEAALPLRRGDVLVVPEQVMNPFYVVGEVLAPRNYYMPPGRVLTASQAISYAQGPTPSAKMSSGILVRYDASGTRKELKVDYAAILKGEQDDFPIQPNDIIFIPGSKIKNIAYGMVRLTSSMAMTTAFRVGRTYQLPDRPTPDAPQAIPEQ